MTCDAVFEDVLGVGRDNSPNARVVVIVSDDEGRSWRPYTPVFPSSQTEVAYTIAEAMNARVGAEDVQSLQLRLEDA